MDYYKILEVTPTASEEVIRMAYKALAKKYHPDTYKGDKEFAQKRMSMINQAYEVLSDSVKRADYDKSQTSKSDEGRQASQKEEPTADTQKSKETGSSTDRNTETAYHKPEPEYRPPQSKASYKRRSSFVRGFWGLIKVAIVVLIIYGIFSGKLMALIKNDHSTGQTDTQSFGQIIDQALGKSDGQPEIGAVIKDYLVYIQKIDGEGALSLVEGQRITDVTNAIIQVYDGFNTPGNFGYELMKEGREFKYKLEPAVLSDDSLSATVDVQIKVANLHAVVTVAQMDASQKLSDEEWVSQYALEAALSGNTEATEIDVLNDCIKEALKLDIDKLEYNVRFSLDKVADKWVISEITDDNEFADAVTGNALDLVGELLGVTS